MIKKLEKADGQSMDIVENNIEQMKELFPEVFAEGRINFDRLQEVLGNYVVTDEGHYNFTWHGKRAAGRLAQTPSTGTLRPCPQESVDWNKTQNLFIEGDNLEVLKLLQKPYHRQIKMIYIDPPYNTGNDFVYEDDFKDGVKNYLAVTGQLDDEGKKKGTNSSAAGRYHTNWLNMMYPRLRLARNLLRDDGVIFISIDDNELTNLTKLCHEVFGEENLINHFVWKKNSSGKTVTKQFPINIDHLLMYAKSDKFKINVVYKPLSEATVASYSKDDNDGRGKYCTVSLQKTKSPGPETTYDYTDNEGRVWPCPAKGWRMTKEKVKDLENQGRLYFSGDTLREKCYWDERDNEGKIADTLWDDLDENNIGTAELKKLFGIDLFDNPKPTDLLNRCLNIGSSNNDSDIILDFFAGSGSTAHSIFNLNSENSGNRRFIAVQLPELTDEKSEAYKAGYKNIADISKERIRRAAKKIKEENPLFSGDLGFKVFKLDTSNIKTWEAGFDTLKDDLIAAADYIKQDRSSDDIVFELLLKYGLDLTVPIETRMIAGKKVYSIGMGALVVCLDNDVPMETVNGIGALKEELKPEIMRVVFKDSGFKDDVVKTNALQTLKRFGIEDIKSL